MKLSIYKLFIFNILYDLVCDVNNCLLVVLKLGCSWSVFVKLLKVLFGIILIGKFNWYCIMLFISLLSVLFLFKINKMFILEL